MDDHAHPGRTLAAFAATLRAEDIPTPGTLQDEKLFSLIGADGGTRSAAQGQ